MQPENVGQLTVWFTNTNRDRQHVTRGPKSKFFCAVFGLDEWKSSLIMDDSPARCSAFSQNLNLNPTRSGSFGRLTKFNLCIHKTVCAHKNYTATKGRIACD